MCVCERKRGNQRARQGPSLGMQEGQSLVVLLMVRFGHGCSPMWETCMQAQFLKCYDKDVRNVYPRNQNGFTVGGGALFRKDFFGFYLSSWLKDISSWFEDISRVCWRKTEAYRRCERQWDLPKKNSSEDIAKHMWNSMGNICEWLCVNTNMKQLTCGFIDLGCLHVQTGRAD